MKQKYPFKLIIIFFIFLLYPLTAHAEEITDFTALVKINTDATVNIREQISYDFGNIEKHGIFRTIPFTKTNSEGKSYKLDLNNFHVTDKENHTYQFSQSTEGSKINLKIGDPVRTVSGQHEYDITYSVSGAITYYSDHDEFYWNITGNGWQAPIGRVQADIVLPDNTPADQIRASCFTGIIGSRESQCTARINSNSVNILSDRTLSAGEGLTVVVGFPKNLVSVLEPQLVNGGLTPAGNLVAAIFGIVVLILSLIWYIGLPVWIIFRWYRFGRDPKAPMGVAKAWFSPPTGKRSRLLTPGETGTLIDEEADMRDITATVVDLARRSFIKIIEFAKNDFYLKKTGDYEKDPDLQPHEITLLNGIFKDADKNNQIRLKDANLVDTVSKVKNQLYEAAVLENLFPENPQKVRLLYMVLSGIALFTFNIPLAIIAFVFGRAMPRKTLSGAQAANVAQALKNFLVSQEKPLEYQAKNQLFFEKLLPYAVAFGVEKIWAARFADIAIAQPSWYQGYSTGNFNSLIFMSALNSGLTGFTSAATPTQSSSGFSSGFGGGGFSGGGGGGGGGGSW